MAKDKQKVNRAKQDAKNEQQNAPQPQNAAEKAAPAQTTMIGGYKPLPQFKGCRNC